ncbi:MAG: IS110 family transposase [Paracoccus sp. (in: a-proteobacteria)]|uniref:IS110 family transposase n=1 Tax=Paracoccus sp. TaxID=267 RepID=UPI00405848C9
MASTIRVAATQHWAGKAPSHSKEKWLKRALGAARNRDRSNLDITCKGPLVLLTRYVTPAEIRQAGKRRIMAHLARTPHVQSAEALADHALAAARAQTLAVPGEAPMAELVRELATEAFEARVKILRLDRDLAGLLAVHPDGALIQSLPGMGAVLVAEFIACVGDIRRFPSADALASAAGLAPVIRQSGRKAGWRRTYGGDKALKRVFYQGRLLRCLSKGSALQGVLRPEATRRKTPHPGAHRSRTSTRHRALDHDPAPTDLQSSHQSCLTSALRSPSCDRSGDRAPLFDGHAGRRSCAAGIFSLHVIQRLLIR